MPLRSLLTILVLVFSGLGGLLLHSGGALASHSACTDSIDNDGDLHSDYPQDPGCRDAADQSEEGDVPAVMMMLSDGRSDVHPGMGVTYAVTLRQAHASFVHIPVQLTLPPGVEFLSASAHGIYREGMVWWEGVTVFSEQPTVLTVHGTVRPDLPAGADFLAQAASDGVIAVDTTRLRPLPQPGDAGRFALLLTDGRTEVRPAGTLRYQLDVRHQDYREATVDVRLTLPSYTRVVGATAGAELEGKVLLWRKVRFAPWERRTFATVLHIDRSVPEGFALRAHASIGPIRVTDQTLAILRAPGVSPVIPHPSVPVALEQRVLLAAAPSSRGGEQEDASAIDVFSARVDPSEVLPGGMLRLTATVRNPFPRMLGGLSISARFQPEGARILRLSDGGVEVRSGRVRFTVPDLLPRAMWTGRFVLRLSDDMPHGGPIHAIFSLEGQDEELQGLPLSDRVSSLRSTVLGALPRAGAPLDRLFLAVSALSALFFSLLHRKIFLG